MLYVMWYGFGRFFIEGLRTDSLYLFDTSIRVSQLLAAVSCIAATVAWIVIRNRVLSKQAEATYQPLFAGEQNELVNETDRQTDLEYILEEENGTDH